MIVVVRTNVVDPVDGESGSASAPCAGHGCVFDVVTLIHVGVVFRPGEVFFKTSVNIVNTHFLKNGPNP